MRVLRFRYPDQRRVAADAKSKTFRGGSESSVGRQFVPLRIAQPHGADGATRGCRDRREMTAGSSGPKLPVSLAANPLLSSWIRFSTEGQVLVSPGKVEIGQGIVTTLAQLAADERDVDSGRVKMVRAPAGGSPNEGVTWGSLSGQQAGRASRQAGGGIREIFLTAASERFEVDADSLGI